MVGKSIDDIKRVREILSVLMNAGFSELLKRSNLDTKLPFIKRFTAKDRDPSPVRLREAFEELGPTFIKLGQALAQRPDIVPQQYINELENLEDNVNKIDSTKVRSTIEESLGKPVDELFRYFDDQPVASASIAQVHRAELHSGEQVAVKVIKPDIRQEMETDLHIMQWLVNQAEGHSSYLQKRHITDIFQNFKNWTENELDLRKEARNAEKLKKNFADDENVRIPYVHREYSSKDVLTAEFIEGVKIDDVDELKKRDVDVQQIAVTGIDALLTMVLRDGFFHADPHPANVFVDSQSRICYLDFGIVGKISPRKRRYLALTLLNAADLDAGGVVDSITKIAAVEDDADLKEFEEEVEQILLEADGAPISEVSFAGEFLNIVQAAARNGVILPTQFVAAGKSFVQVEGVGLTIHPDFKPQQKLRSRIQRIVIQQNRPQDVARNFMMSLLENRDLIEDAPNEIAEILDTLKRSKSPNNTKDLINRGAKKIVGAIIASTLIISGTALLGITNDPTLHIIAAAELGVGILLGLMLLR